VAEIRFNICYSVPNFIKIGRFFHWDMAISSWILKICRFCHVALPTCRSAFSYKISLKSDYRSMSYSKKAIFKMAAAAILNFQKKSIFGHVTVIGFYVCCSVPNFIKIGRFLTEIWRFNDFQNGGRLPSWILKISSICHVALVDMPFCLLVQNFAEIGQSVDELWPKSDI